MSTEQDGEVEYPLACQESSNSGSKNVETGTSEMIYDEDEVANEGDKRSIFIHGNGSQFNTNTRM